MTGYVLFSLVFNLPQLIRGIPNSKQIDAYMFNCLFVCFVALHPKSTAMVMGGRSVHLATLFPRQA